MTLTFHEYKRVQAYQRRKCRNKIKFVTMDHKKRFSATEDTLAQKNLKFEPRVRHSAISSY